MDFFLHIGNHRRSIALLLLQHEGNLQDFLVKPLLREGVYIKSPKEYGTKTTKIIPISFLLIKISDSHAFPPPINHCAENIYIEYINVIIRHKYSNILHICLNRK
jgi:hypothetical protein